MLRLLLGTHPTSWNSCYLFFAISGCVWMCYYKENVIEATGHQSNGSEKNKGYLGYERGRKRGLNFPQGSMGCRGYEDNVSSHHQRGGLVGIGPSPILVLMDIPHGPSALTFDVSLNHSWCLDVCKFRVLPHRSIPQINKHPENRWVLLHGEGSLPFYCPQPKFISQDGVAAPFPPLTDGLNSDEPCHLPDPQFPHLLRWSNNTFLVRLLGVNEIMRAKDL